MLIIVSVLLSACLLIGQTHPGMVLLAATAITGFVAGISQACMLSADCSCQSHSMQVPVYLCLQRQCHCACDMVSAEITTQCLHAANTALLMQQVVSQTHGWPVHQYKSLVFQYYRSCIKIEVGLNSQASAFDAVGLPFTAQ